MKTGALLIITAIALSTGTVLWSIRQKVQRSDMASQSCLVGVEAVKQTANAQFFPSERVHRVEVAVPVNVELDETFTGVELIGDTALFRYLEVMVNDYRKSSGSISVKMKPVREHGFNKDGNYYTQTRFGGDSLSRKLIAETNITARIGIGSPEHTDQHKRTFRFTGCPKITAKTSITGHSIDWMEDRVDSTWVNFNVENLDFSKTNPNPSYIKFSGKILRANYQVSHSFLDTDDVVSNEVYIVDARNSFLKVFSSEIFNARRLFRSEVKLSGNPKYRHIKAEDQSMVSEVPAPTGNHDTERR